MTLSTTTLRVAIIGAGPSGFYAAESLQKASPMVRIDMFDRLPTPHGLVRGGVAPDHPRIKSVTRVFDRIAGHPGFRFAGNVTIGTDVGHAELREHYDAVIYAVGAGSDRSLGVPGEELRGSHAATELVGWYNGNPDFQDARFDFGVEAAAVIGLGNVAMDVTRILARHPDELAVTDIADHAVDSLRQSAVSTIHVLGRRGPVQGAFTTPELRELGELDGVDVVVHPEDLALDPVSAEHLARGEDRTLTKNLDVLRDWAARPPTAAARRIVFHFCVSPVEILGTDGRVSAIRIVRNRLERDGRGGVRAVPTGETEVVPVGLVFRSVGYRGVAIPGVPFDPAHGVFPNAEGRMVEHEGSHTPVDGVYVCGWIKRGPSGVIGTNKSCAMATVDHLIADAVTGRITPSARSGEDLLAVLRDRGVAVTSWDDWLAIDRAECAAGKPLGKPRVKFTSIAAMLEAARREERS
jgi:ferredoxin--NADP+ reductase